MGAEPFVGHELRDLSRGAYSMEEIERLLGELGPAYRRAVVSGDAPSGLAAAIEAKLGLAERALRQPGFVRQNRYAADCCLDRLALRRALERDIRANGLTQAGLGQRLGVSQQSVAKMLKTAQVAMPQDRLADLVRALGEDAEFLKVRASILSRFVSGRVQSDTLESERPQGEQLNRSALQQAALDALAAAMGAGRVSDVDCLELLQRWVPSERQDRAQSRSEGQ